MSQVKIKQVGPDQAPLVLDLVGKLLTELGEEGEDTGPLDVDKLTAAWRANERRHLAFLAYDSGGAVVGVATVDVGFALYAGGEFGVINEMCVVPGFRSRGVGGLLLEAVKALGHKRGWRRLDVTAPESARWARTRRFYERHGFVFTGPKLKNVLA